MNLYELIKKELDNYFGEWIVYPINKPYFTVEVKKEKIIEVSKFLKETLNFDYLVFITAVDYIDNVLIIYHLLSISKSLRLVLQVKLGADALYIESVSGIWPGADWYEREVWDLFGVKFLHHPNLQRILLFDDFEGHPLRKDFPLITQ